jgi:hypothetical protein
MSEGNRPTHKVYSAQKREGEKDWLTLIGKAWPFEFRDKKTNAMRTGMNIQLSAMPIGDRMVLFEYTDEDEKREEAPKATQKPKR